MYILYGGKYTRSLMVEMVMAELGLEYEVREIDIFKKEHRSQEYLDVNPAGWIPALVTPEGDRLFETQAINLFLAERHGIPLLAPATEDPARGQFLSALFCLTGEMEPAVKRIYFAHRYAGSENTEEVRKRAWKACRQTMEVVNGRLKEAGPFHLGDRFSLPDIGMAYWATSFEHQGLIDGLPFAASLVEKVRERPSLKKSFEKLSGWAKEIDG